MGINLSYKLKVKSYKLAAIGKPRVKGLKSSYLMLGTLFFALIISSCNKKLELPNWNSDYMFPIAHGKLDLTNLLGSEHVKHNTDQSLSLFYADTLYSLKLDTLLKLPDTTIVQSFPWTFPAVLIPKGTPIFTGDNIFRTKINSAHLFFVKVKSGKVLFSVKNTISEKLVLEYKLPKALKNGDTLKIIRIIPAGSISNPGIFKDSIDLSGYDIDMTRKDGTDYNLVITNYSITIDPNGNDVTVNNGDFAEINTTFKQVIPEYARGYFGNIESKINKSQYLKTFQQVNGTLDLDEIKMEFKIKNGVGVDAEILFHELYAKNSKTNSKKTLQSSIIGNSIFIDRAQEGSAGKGPVMYSTFSRSFNKQNSNFDELVEIFPDSIGFHVDFKFNPLVNPALQGDFIYHNTGIDLLLETEIPLYLSAQGLQLTDTLALSFSEDLKKQLEKANQATLNIICKNNVPFSASLSGSLYNKQNQYLDSLAMPRKTIQSAQTNGNNEVISETESIVIITLNKSQINTLLNADKLLIKITFNTPNSPLKIKMKSSDFMDINVALDVNYEY